MNSRLFKRSLSLVFLSCLLVSCALDNLDDKFLFFINVNTGATLGTCFLALVLQCAAIYFHKYFRIKSGWRSQERERNIYNNNGEKVGSFGTGQYDQWYVSEEEADHKTAIINTWGWIARISLPRAFLVGFVVSWILPNHIFWDIVVWLAIAPFWIFKRYNKGSEATVYTLPEIIYIIILIICCIIYFD